MEKKKVIVVEDDPDILFTVQLALENSGYLVTALHSGKAIMEDRCELPDLFLLDKRMPDMDGLDLCRYLCSKPEYQNIPIIIMSASPKFGAAAIAAGASDFLVKPFSLGDLITVVSIHTSPSSCL